MCNVSNDVRSAIKQYYEGEYKFMRPETTITWFQALLEELEHLKAENEQLKRRNKE